jgi:hypothetical protein
MQQPEWLLPRSSLRLKRAMIGKRAFTHCLQPAKEAGCIPFRAFALAG